MGVFQKSSVFSTVDIPVRFALRSAGGVRVAVGAPFIGSNVLCEAVSPLRFPTSGASKTADWLALMRLPVSQAAVISGVSDLSGPLIGSAPLTVLCVCSSAATGRLSSRDTGPWPGLAGAGQFRGGGSSFFPCCSGSRLVS